MSEHPIGAIVLAKPLHQLVAEKAHAMEEVVAEDDVQSFLPELLGLMAELRNVLDPMIENLVVTLRSFETPWSEIGLKLGVSRQAAWERYRHLDGTMPRSVVIEAEAVAGGTQP